MFISGGHELVFHDASTYKVIHRHSPKKIAKIKQVSWNKDNKFLVYLADGGKPIILSCRDRDKIRSIVEVNLDVPYASVTFPRTTKKTLGIGCQTGDLFTYNTKTSTRVPIHFEPFSDAVHFVDYNATDKVIAAAAGNCVRIYDSLKGTQPEMTRTLASNCMAMRFHPHHAHTLAMGTIDGTVLCLDVTTNSTVYEMHCHKEPVAALAFSHRTNKCLITASTDNKYAIHSIMDKTVVQCGHLPYGLTALDVSDDRHTMLIGTEFGQVYQYDLRNYLTPVTSFKAHKSPVLCLRFANDLMAEAGLVHCGSGAIGCGTGISARDDGEVNFGQRVSNTVDGGAVDKCLMPIKSMSLSHQMHNSASTALGGAICANSLFDSVQERILRDIGADMTELGVLMAAQMGNLQQFIKKEVDKVDAQNHDKWELLITAAATSGGDSCADGGCNSCCSSAHDTGDKRRIDGPGSGDVVQHGGGSSQM